MVTTLIRQNNVASWHVRTLPHQTPSTFWGGLSSFSLEYGGQVAYMKTRPLSLHFWLEMETDSFNQKKKKRKGANLETKHLEVRHMSRP